MFTGLQAFEYLEAPFSFADSIFGTTFYAATGLHGLHVIVGTIFIFIVFLRFMDHHFYVENTLALDCAAWYWHFVDIVWILVFFVVY